jgi:hypothetical protein
MGLEVAAMEESAMKRLMYTALVVLALCAGAVMAQAPPATGEKMPALTELQRLTVQNKVQAAQLAGAQAEPKALASAIADLIEQRQRAAQQAGQDLSTYYQTLAVEGYTLNPSTWAYEKKVGGK